MPQLHLLVGVEPAHLPLVRDWAAHLAGRPAILLQGYSNLHGQDLGLPTFSEFDLVPTSSETEEDIYRRVFEFSRERDSQLSGVRFLNVPLIRDLDSVASSTPERHLGIATAVRMLLDQEFDQVVVVLQYYSAFHFVLFREAVRDGLVPPGARPLSPVAGKLEPLAYTYDPLPPDQLVPGLRSLVKPVDRAALAALADGVPRGQPLLLALSANPIFARNAASVAQSVRDRCPSLPVFVDTEATATALASLGCDNVRVVHAAGQHDLENSGKAIGAISALLSDLHRLATTKLAEQNTDRSSGITRFLRRWRRHGTSPAPAEAMTAEPLLWTLSASLLQQTTCTRLVEYCGFVEKMAWLLDELRPISVFRIPSVGNYFDHAIADLCRERSIRLIASSVLSFDARYRNLNRFDYDVLTVLGDEQAEVIHELGLAKDVVPVGQPDLDEARRKWSLDRSRQYVEERLGHVLTRKLVLVATSALAPRSELVWIEALARFAKERGDCEIVVKLHPTTPAGAYEALRRRDDWPLHIVTDWEILPFLVLADVVLTDASHAGKQALYLEKPLIAVNMTGTPFPYNRFEQDGVAVLSQSVEQLLRDLTPLLDDPVTSNGSTLANRQAFIRRHLTANDGRASARIARLLFDPAAIPEVTFAPAGTALSRAKGAGADRSSA